MKKREIQELKSKQVGELHKILKDFRGELQALQFKLAAGKLKNGKQVHFLKKDIARVLTVLHNK